MPHTKKHREISALTKNYEPPLDPRAVRKLEKDLALVARLHALPNHRLFGACRQDRNGGNAGDLIKVLVDDALEALEPCTPDTSPTVLEPTAGAGCYPVRQRCALMNVLKSDPYFELMESASPLLAGDMRIIGKPPGKGPRFIGNAPSRVPEFIGVGPMLLLRHKVKRYVAFEHDADVLHRLEGTLSRLGLSGAGEPELGDGWQGSLAFLHGSADDRSPLVVFIDPFSFSKPVDQEGLRSLMQALAERPGPVAVAIFNPGIRVRGQWMKWRAAESLIASVTPAGWFRDSFFLRKELPANSNDVPKSDGRCEHFSLHLLTNEAVVATHVRAKWNARCQDPVFAAWASPY